MFEYVLEPVFKYSNNLTVVKLNWLRNCKGFVIKIFMIYYGRSVKEGIGEK